MSGLNLHLRLTKNGVTHVITMTNLIEEKYLTRFRYLLINLSAEQRYQYEI